MSFSVDNLSSLASSYNKPFFHPMAEVHFYIDGENITSEKFTFENVVIKGNTVASLSFSQGDNAVSNYKVFSDDEAVTLTISSDDLDSYGLESHIETNFTKISSRSDITSFTVATPDKNAVSQNAIQVTTLQDGKTPYLLGANLYIRPKNSKADWTSYVSVINEYIRIPTADNPFDVSFPLGLIGKDGGDYKIRFKNVEPQSNLGELNLNSYINSLNGIEKIFIFRKDGKVIANPNNYHTEIMTSFKLLNDNGVEVTEGMPFTQNKYFTIEMKGLKRDGFGNYGNLILIKIDPTTGSSTEFEYDLFVP